MSDPRKGYPSASSMARYKACPGSWTLEKGCPDVKSEDAQLGTLGHAVLAGEKPMEVLDDKMRETVETAIRLTNEVIEKHGFLSDGVHIVREDRLWSNGPVCYSGQPDLVAIKGNDVLIIDYKLLYGDHDEAAANLQLRTLAVLADCGGPVTCALIQPWAKGQVTVTQYDQEDLQRAREEINGIVSRTIDPNAKREAGSHCKYCRAAAAGVCPEANKLVDKAVVLAGAATIESCTPEARGRMLDWIEFAEDVLSNAKKRLHRFVKEEPGSVEGYTVKPGNEVRKIGSVINLYYALKGLNVDINTFINICNVNVGDAEKLFKAKSGLKGKQAKEEFERVTKEIIVLTKNQDSVVKIK